MSQTLFLLATSLLSSMVWQVGAGQNVSNYSMGSLDGVATQETLSQRLVNANAKYSQSYYDTCVTDADCADDKACVNGGCINPCDFSETYCECKVINHITTCIPICNNGPCYTTQCRSDRDCNSVETCVYGSCVNPCEVPQRVQCESYSTCVAIDRIPYCKCFNPSFYYNCPIRINGQYFQTPHVSRRKTFYIPDVKTTWSESLNYCRSNGLRLATIDNEVENKLAVSLAEKKFLTWSAFWIAGKYHEDDNRWWWHVDSQNKGEPIEKYKNFHLFMDKVTFGDCLAYCSITPIGLIVQGYRWAGKPCSHKHYFICEKYE